MGDVVGFLKQHLRKKKKTQRPKYSLQFSQNFKNASVFLCLFIYVWLAEKFKKQTACIFTSNLQIKIVHLKSIEIQPNLTFSWRLLKLPHYHTIDERIQWPHCCMCIACIHTFHKKSMLMPNNNGENRRKNNGNYCVHKSKR